MLRKTARALLDVLELTPAELSVLLTDDESIRALNRNWRGKDAATDVLSFAQVDDVRGAAAAGLAEANRPPFALGDVVISLETAARQAEALGIDCDARLRTLLIHGLAHLLGYDHERSPVEARRQFACERELAACLDTALTARGTDAPRRSRAAVAGAAAPSGRGARQTDRSGWRPNAPAASDLRRDR